MHIHMPGKQAQTGLEIEKNMDIGLRFWYNLIGYILILGGKAMLSKKVVELLNDQVNKEFYSAYLYLDMSNYYKNEGLDGFANWYKIQAQEERDHAVLFIEYLQQNGEAVVLEAIGKPDKEFSKFTDPLEAGAEHERFVTGLIHNIYAAAYDEKDFRTMQFLDWFVKEQA